MDMNNTNVVVAELGINVPNQIQETVVVPTAMRPIEPFFHPQALRDPSPDYEEFMSVRQKILDVIHNETPENKKFIEDVSEALLQCDGYIPMDIVSGILAVAKVGKKVKYIRKQRVLYTKVITSVLEMIFDPVLEFKMTKKDILDVFDANGIDRDKVYSKQIGHIYVKVIHKLQTGVLRDIAYEAQLYRYVQLKLWEIKLSRQDWDINGR